VQPPERRAVESTHVAPAAEPRLGGLCQFVRLVVRGALSAPIDELSRLFRFRALPCRSRKLRRLGAKIVASNCADLPNLFPALPQTHPCNRRACGSRVRDCESFRAFDVWSSPFDSERARPAPRPCGDGSVAGGASCDLWPSFRATGDGCGLPMCHWAGHVIDPTPVLRVPKAENVRTTANAILASCD
jgi:hypothetical protein